VFDVVWLVLLMYCEFDGLWLFCSCIVSLMVSGGFALIMYCEFDGLWLVLLMYCEFDGLWWFCSYNVL
jgi:desulfoferrodoxin (superoxide reductase-like protein)